MAKAYIRDFKKMICELIILQKHSTIKTVAKYMILLAIQSIIKTIDDGWVYLFSILDLFSRKVIAWNVEDNMRKQSVIKTLQTAFKNRNYPKNVIVHSDKASQYRSFDENANQESFHATIKKDWLYHQSFNSIYDVKRAYFEYIEGFYNKRIHSSIGYSSPIDFELDYFSNIPLLSMSYPLT